jgi:uncharacterized protein
VATIALESFEDMDLAKALVVVAFPTTGSASSIAAQYLLRHLGLPLVGHLRIPELSSVMAIDEGRATSAVRIYGGEVECKLAGGCPRVYIVTTELALSSPVAGRIGDAVVALAKRDNARLVLVMEGVHRSEGDETPDVFSASSDKKVLKELVKAGIPAMERALIAGIAAQVILSAPGMGVAAAAVLVEARRDHPDGRAAVALIEAFHKILPEVDIDPKPLLKEALQLEADIKRAQQHAVDQNALPPAPSFI